MRAHRKPRNQMDRPTGQKGQNIMTDREIAKRAYDKIMSELFQFDRCPTYALAKITLENMTSKGEVFLMEEYRFIKYVGLNSNGFETYQVRA